MINEALDNICPGEPLKHRPRFGTVRPTLRAIRNVDKWERATIEQLKKEYRMPLPPMQGESSGSYQIFNGDEMGTDSKDDKF